MSRWFALFLIVFPCLGCGSAPQETSRTVPVTQGPESSSADKAAAKAPRAIATH